MNYLYLFANRSWWSQVMAYFFLFYTTLCTAGTQDITSCLNKLRGKLNAAEERDELSFLTSLFQNPQFQQAVNIHRKLVSVTTLSPPPKPEATDAYQTSSEVMEELQNAQSPYSLDLLEMLSSPGFRVSIVTRH